MELFTAIYFLLLVYTMITFCKYIFHKRNQCCYMLNYECYTSTDDRKLDTESCGKIVQRNKNLGLEEYRFLLQTIVSAGIGEETYGPRNVIEGREECPTTADALWELDDIIFQTLDKLFASSGVLPSEIDILVVNVSLLSPAPSLTARVINRYKMRENIKVFNLSGMGCSASLIAVDLVRHLFRLYNNAFAIVVSTESIGPHWYCGKEKSMILSNCLFRSGGCSMLLTNNRALERQAILKLSCSVRTHLAADDDAYNCCMQVEDDRDYRGFLLTKSLKKAAAKALSMNFRVLVPKMLPFKELLRYVIVSRLRKKIKSLSIENTAGASLNLKAGIEHFCIHPGGKAVIDGVGKSLGLGDYDLEPARMALHRFGNTSAGGLWYVLGYMQAKKRLKKGDKILMISLGAGFKCNNCVWEVLRDLDDANVWKGCIQHYPTKPSTNPFMEKYSWINDEHLSYIKLC
ncbi:3-ketoacyl-CoA synthase 19 [Carica papaya]|uniref:3-ketoacyl-CoA synthase 19 n=1 Tax=Carica papaya TaxID=3649 RepID=UPI000B8C7738|nr:3-ketoacyl-CoA synthase 19 [Carica papaya]